MVVSLTDYIGSFWNQADILATVFLITGLVLGKLKIELSLIGVTYINDWTYKTGRVLFAVATLLYFFRVLQFYVISKRLGPNVIMVYKMVRTIMYIF